MPEKEYMYIFILCAYLSQGIIAAFLEEDIGESSNVLVREKRVINRKPGKDVPVNNGAYPYIVNVKKNMRVHCVGSILSHHTAITAARCISSQLSLYTVFSGSIIVSAGIRHNVTESKFRGHDPSRSSSFMTGIALITVRPPFTYRVSTGHIELYTGFAAPGMRGRITGWGAFLYGGPRETTNPQKLRSITAPIMNHRQCVDIYREYFPITEEDICTYHAEKQCGYTDAGAPLVIDDALVGVYIGYIETEGGRGCPIKPDVFAFLQHENYNEWIRLNIVE